MPWIRIVALMAISLAAFAGEPAQPASVRKLVVPDYPARALRHDITGTVVLRVQVLADGGVGELQVQKSSGDVQLDAAAVQAARKSEYAPAQAASGGAVDSWILTPYRFVIQ